MAPPSDLRVAWVVPTVESGAYWRPLLLAFAKGLPQTRFFTGRLWGGFDPRQPGCEVLEQVGRLRHLALTEPRGCNRGLMILSWGLIGRLLRFRPHVVLVQAYSLWTLFVALLKPLLGWRMAILYDGSAPNADFRSSRFRTVMRRLLSRPAAAFVANGAGARSYLVDCLGVPEERVTESLYLVPDGRGLAASRGSSVPRVLPRPVFLYVGRLVKEKGLRVLLEASARLEARGLGGHGVRIVGSGPDQEALRRLALENGLGARVSWEGWIRYEDLGPFLRAADVFVFPSFEDVWGVAVLEAMSAGKPVLCSSRAGCAELVRDGENGWRFDPDDPESLVRVMAPFVGDTGRARRMGDRARRLIAPHTPERAAGEIAALVERLVPGLGQEGAVGAVGP